MNYLKIKITVLDAFKYEEETIFHVENYLKNTGIQIERYTVISILSELLKEGLIELFDDPSNGQVKFENCSDNYVEDYWFALTDKGYNELSMHKEV
ncbi:hypothetical protein [Clostridium intestinale]|uniref:hypothetical protein n=1 Tax=Clostridium intestinale TaxID=36845 RepID=UPI002DD63FBA|nr:hypothetical protein [Clostridium intestinale]WRY53160.1 hypothetical protein P8F83_08115 [Clostridium intestinale]